MSYETNYAPTWTRNQTPEVTATQQFAVARRRGGWNRNDEQEDEEYTNVAKRMRVGPLGAYLASLSHNDDY